MRLSSLVSILVVGSSLVLGGCAADAEPTGGEPGTEPIVALQQPSDPVAPIDRTNDARQVDKVSDFDTGPTAADQARQGQTWTNAAASHYAAGTYSALPQR